MPKPKLQFVIDDTQSVSANLQNFTALLEQLDRDLAKILGPLLQDFAASEPADLHGVWDALLDATVPEANDVVPARDAA